MNDVNSSIKIDTVDSSSSTILTKLKYISANGVWLQTRLLCSAAKKLLSTGHGTGFVLTWNLVSHFAQFHHITSSCLRFRDLSIYRDVVGGEAEAR